MGWPRWCRPRSTSLLAADPDQRQAQLDILHDAFIPWLATINPDNDQPMRRVARWDDLPAASHPLIQAMVEKRLLVKDTRDGQTVVEVALESLLRQWHELAAWLRDEARGPQGRRHLERAAADWQASGRDESWLLEGTRLAEAETLAAQPGFRDRLSPTRDYLHASRGVKTTASRPNSNASKPNCKRPSEHAASLRKRSRILIAVLARHRGRRRAGCEFSVCRPDAAARKQADVRFREATSLRLVSEAPRCWPVPVLAAQCVGTNSCSWRDDWRANAGRRSTARCAAKVAISSRSPKSPTDRHRWCGV